MITYCNFEKTSKELLLTSNSLEVFHVNKKQTGSLQNVRFQLDTSMFATFNHL